MLRWAAKRLYDTEPVFTSIEQKCPSIVLEQKGGEVGRVGVVNDERTVDGMSY